MKEGGKEVIQGPEEKPHGDQGIKEPEKEPSKGKRSAEPYPDLDREFILKKETSGLQHLRRRRLEEITS